MRYFGPASTDERENDYIKGLKHLQAPNDLDLEVYLYRPPAAQISFHRAGLLLAAKDMLRNGRVKTALNIALASDSLMGENCNTYSAIHDLDSIFNTREEMPLIFKELSDSLLASEDSRMKRVTDKIRNRATILSQRDSLRDEEWKRYYRTLQPRLRLKMSR